MLVTVRDACSLQDNALEVHVGDQVEQLDQLITDAGDGTGFFAKTHITGGMETLLREAFARLAGRSSTGIFHLKQAMGGGKTHLLVGLGLTARLPALRQRVCAAYPYADAFGSAQVAAFNGRNNPSHFFWGEIAEQLGRGSMFRKFWESGPRFPDERDWLALFDTGTPILILLDEMPPYLHALETQPTGNGTVADIATTAFANLLTAAGKKSNVCVVVSDLTAAYDAGQKRISQALSNARQELGRQERSITPVDMSGNEIYEILRKRLFKSLPPRATVDDIAAEYGRLLEEATKAKVASRRAESISEEIAATYPFHPRFKNIIALFENNEQFRQTRGVLELVSRLLKSVWARPTNDVYLLGPQHFDLGITDVRDALSGIADMRAVVARDLWDANHAAHAQVADLARSTDAAAQVGALLLTASLSTSVDAVRGLTRETIVEILVAPNRRPSEFIEAHEHLVASAWYLHQSQDGHWYFDRQENLTKLLHSLAEQAPANRIEELQRNRLGEMFEAKRPSVYSRVLALPAIDTVTEQIRRERVLLIISPDSKLPPESVQRLFASTTQKNNVCVLTGDKSHMASFDRAARDLYATMKADARIASGHAQREELNKRTAAAEQNLTSVVLNLFDKVLFPFQAAGKPPELKAKPLDKSRDASVAFDGQLQIEKTLVAAPQKLFLEVEPAYGALKEKAEALLWPVGSPEVRWSDAEENARAQAGFPWLPPRGLESLKVTACARGEWEDLGNGYVTRSPKPPTTGVQVVQEAGPNDAGEVRLRISAINGGPAPRIHFALDGQATVDSPVLHEPVLETRAMRVSFLCVDSSGRNSMGPAVLWRGRLTLRSECVAREVHLMVAPVTDAVVRYTTDGSEPRYGTVYAAPIPIPTGPAGLSLLVFAEHDGIEARESFHFPGDGKGPPPVPPGPASIHAKGAPKRLDARGKVNRALAKAREIGATFEEIQWTLGSGSRVATFMIGEVPLSAAVLESLLGRCIEQLSGDAFPADAALSMSFRRAHFGSGHDLMQFVAEFELKVAPDEIAPR